jgi:hypothetical protein
MWLSIARSLGPRIATTINQSDELITGLRLAVARPAQ